MEQVQQLIGHLFRHETGKMAAVLTRLLGFTNLETAEDIVQDTLIQAMSTWKYRGIPENPSAWLYTAAKNKAIDVIRKGKRIEHHHQEIANLLRSEWTLANTVNQFFLEDEIEDSQLRMMFACCHPTIPYESQIALTLKTLCGLSVAEIANGFLTNEETISKRIYRAREKIKQENIELDLPPLPELMPRLDAVLKTLYLLFNEGYNSSHPDTLIRQDLCEEAMRLCLLLTQHRQSNLPETRALLALMCLQASRFDARVGDDGCIVLLKHQDRSKWNRKLIDKGLYYLEAAAEGERLSEYHLEASIGACHALAENFDETDWKRIYLLYETLAEIKLGPIIELNKAIALGYAHSAKEGLEALLKIKNLEKNNLYYTSLGDFYLQTGDEQKAQENFAIALTITTSKSEIELLNRKLASTATLSSS